jgi:hypothetical protein
MTKALVRKANLRVRGHLGIPKRHELLRDGQHLEATTGIMDWCRQATAGRVLTPPDRRFESVEWLGFNQAPEIIATVALHADNQLLGFLSTGTNPYRPFDDACEEYIKDLTRTASRSLTKAAKRIRLQ